MAFIVWIAIGIAAALIINMLRGHDTVLNTVAAIIGAAGSGAGYALLFKESSESIMHALNTATWENTLASIVGAAVLVVLTQLFTLERKEYKTN